MFGCVGRIVVGLVVIALCAVAYVTRGAWEPRVRAKLGMKAPVVAGAPKWEPITVAGAERARAAIETLRRPAGPVFLNVKASDLVAFALEPAIKRLDAAVAASNDTAKHAEALAGDNVVSIRGSIRMADLGGGKELGPLSGMLEGTQKIEVRGRPEIVSPGKAIFRVERIVVGELTLPSAIIGRVVQRIVPRASKDDPDDAIALALPRDVADIRVTPGKVTLYKNVAEKSAK